MTRLMAFVLLCSCLGASSAVAQTMQGDRVGDVSLGRFRHVQGGAAFGLRHDNSFALRTPGLRRDEAFFIGSIRIPMRITDVALGTYVAYQNVGRLSHFDDETDGQRNNIWGSGEGSLFMFVALPVGDVGARIGYVPEFVDKDGVSTWRTAVQASRTRPIDLVQVLPRTRALRSSLHYRVDYGVIFAQLDLGYDYRWSTSKAETDHTNTDGGIFHMAFQMGLGLSKWGLTYGFAEVWVRKRVFNNSQSADEWSTTTTPNGQRYRAAAHSLAFHYYSRHWSPYAGITLIPSHTDATAFTLGIDYAF